MTMAPSQTWSPRPSSLSPPRPSGWSSQTISWSHWTIHGTASIPFYATVTSPKSACILWNNIIICSWQSSPPPPPYSFSYGAIELLKWSKLKHHHYSNSSHTLWCHPMSLLFQGILEIIMYLHHQCHCVVLLQYHRDSRFYCFCYSWVP